MATGTVKWFNAEGFGGITPDGDPKDLFGASRGDPGRQERPALK
jgi:hypothetical protein